MPRGLGGDRRARALEPGLARDAPALAHLPPSPTRARSPTRATTTSTAPRSRRTPPRARSAPSPHRARDGPEGRTFSPRPRYRLEPAGKRTGKLDRAATRRRGAAVAGRPRDFPKPAGNPLGDELLTGVRSEAEDRPPTHGRGARGASRRAGAAAGRRAGPRDPRASGARTRRGASPHVGPAARARCRALSVLRRGSPSRPAAFPLDQPARAWASVLRSARSTCRPAGRGRPAGPG
jgi:hypothetical protein